MIKRRDKKRGAGMEFTLIVLLVVFSLTALIVTVSVLSTSLTRDCVADFESDVRLTEQANEFFDGVKISIQVGTFLTKYVELTDDGIIFTKEFVDTERENQRLKVVFKKEGDGCQIIDWQRYAQ